MRKEKKSSTYGGKNNGSLEGFGFPRPDRLPVMVELELEGKRRGDDELISDDKEKGHERSINYVSSSLLRLQIAIS
jgi:hypothetical protein